MASRVVASGGLLRAALLQGSKMRCASAMAARDVLHEVPDTQLTELKNGFRVASENNGRHTATIGVWIDSGSQYEHDGNNGVARFLERMLYRGTGKRPQSQIEKELESMGARLNSYTSRDRTAFYAQCHTRDVEKVVEILADMLRNSKLEDEKIELERNVLLRELQQSDEDQQTVTLDYLHQAAFQGTPFQLSPLGTTESLNSISRRDIVDFQKDHYKGVRMVMTGVGGVDHGKLVALGEKYFADIGNQYEGKIPQEVTTGVRFTGAEMRYRDDSMPWMYAACAVEGVGLGHADSVPLMLANAFVGQWDVTHTASANSPTPLAQRVSVIPALQLYESFNINYRNTGLFGVYFVTDGKNLDDTLEVIRNVMRDWKYLASSCRDVDLDRAKNVLKTNIFQALETSTARADDIARQVLYYGHYLPQHQLAKMIDDVDAKTMRAVMSRHAYDRDFASAGVGKTEAFMQYMITRGSMSSWRF